MKTDIYSIDGKKLKSVELPAQFKEPFRPDLIKRAVLSIQSSKRQPYGASKEAGKRYSSKVSRRRRKYRGAYGRGVSRSPRKVMTKRGTQFYWVGATAPFTVGGRRAHPPKAEKIWKQKINKLERRKAIRSALAATLDIELVKKRGHRISNLTTVIENKFEKLSKTKDIKKTLADLGLKDELERIQEKKIRAGRGKLRGRKYKRKVGPLLVISKESPLLKAASNLQGVDACIIKNINTELLAPGTTPGRLTIFTEGAIELLQKNKLFTKNYKLENE